MFSFRPVVLKLVRDPPDSFVCLLKRYSHISLLFLSDAESTTPMNESVPLSMGVSVLTVKTLPAPLSSQSVIFFLFFFFLSRPHSQQVAVLCAIYLSAVAR